MMQEWSPESIAFLCDAADYGSYHEALAARLLPHLPLDGHICDAGCGTGDLALALARRCRKVTAVDRSQAAIHALRQRADAANLEILCADIFSLRERFDAMVFCYFGRIGEVLELAARQCSGTVIFARRNCAEHRFSLERTPYTHRTHDAARVLTERGIPFQRESVSLEFGQPFRSLRDAVRFFRLYNRSEAPVTEAAVAPRLLQTGEARFPLYLPMKRDMELYIFHAGEVRAL